MLGLDLADGRDVVRADDGGVKGQRVGDHGHRHAGGLLAAALVENLSHMLLDDFEAEQLGVFDGAGGDADAALENRDALVDQALGDHGVLDAAHDVVDPPREPAAGGPAEWRGRVAGDHAVVEVRGGDRVGEMGLALAEGCGHAHRDHLFDRIGRGCGDQSEAGLGVVFDAGSGCVLGFDNDRLRAGRSDQNVGSE